MTDKKRETALFADDKYITDFLNKYRLDVSYLDKYFFYFKEAYDSRTLCRNCNGLNDCKQVKEGLFVSLDYDGSIYNDLTYCRYKLDENKLAKQQKNFVRNDIPDKYRDLYLEDVELCDDNIAKLLTYAYDILDKKRTKGLYIYGDLGVGKTYYCMALANSLAKDGEKTAFVKASYFINDMRKLIVSNNEEYEKVLFAIKRVPYLFIDDIGSESVSTYSRDDLLFNILDYRMENSLCTFFTSNLSKDSLAKHYTYDKNDNISSLKAKRLLERIDILSDDYVLKGNNKRRGV